MKKKIAVEFKDKDLERVLNKLIVEHHHFELVGQGIIILLRETVEVFKDIFDCREVMLIPLFSLSRKEANKIRNRHMPG